MLRTNEPTVLQVTALEKETSRMSFEATRGGPVGRHMSKRGGGDIDGWFVERRDSLIADLSDDT